MNRSISISLCQFPVTETYYYKALLSVLVMLTVQACIHFIVTSASVPSNFSDLRSLLAFKAAIKFDPNNILAKNWTSDTNFCEWYGVSCSKHRQRVTALRLFGMGLVGPISPQLGNLSFLTVLDLGNNSFHGHVIQEFSYLSRLKFLSLDYNKLKGEIPTSLSMCRKLQRIDLNNNGLSGMIPKNLTTLPRLQALILGLNNLTGTIPRLLGNMSTLKVLALEQNQFHSTIPNELALLPRLKNLSMGTNYLNGTIPPSLFNVSSLEILALEYNSFTGDLPKDTSLQLPSLIKLYLGGNQLTGRIPSHLYNLSSLTQLGIESNNFTGTLPATLPLSLELLFAHNCNLQGEIPKEIGALKNMTYLTLIENRFSGNIPPTIKGMESMEQLYLDNNQLEGPIPEEICSMRFLGVLSLGYNRLSGSIPKCIGNLSGLQALFLDFNGLSSAIPQSVWSLDKLFYLVLSSNSLHGNLGQNFTAMKSLNTLDLFMNQLSGNIPTSFGLFQSITGLDLSWNSFSGPIPESFGKLITLVVMNISNNNLSGQIPKSLQALTDLKYLNLSYNKLTGEIPKGGPFVNFTPQSFIGNGELCGEPLSKSCLSQGSRKQGNKWFPLSYIVPIIAVLLIVGILFYVFRKSGRNDLHQNPEITIQEQRMISYHELSRATLGFSESNFLGSGSFGHVYKGILSDGEIVAVKVLNLVVDGAIKSFDAECKVLRRVRHRNLIKVISACTNPEFRALVLEFIPNGTLEKWLYSHNYFLSFIQRVSIMLDVALAIDYLHCGQSEPVIHCDLKPSNVLLDNKMVAHVGDFGIAKILTANKIETQTSTLGTFGYIAPEYGVEGRVSTKGDVYSYGVMLLETFTRQKPTDEIFSEELSLRKWVGSATPNRIAEVVDANLLNAESQGISEMSLQRNILAVLDLGLGCSRDLPAERFEMKDVVTKLNKIKVQLLSE